MKRLLTAALLSGGLALAAGASSASAAPAAPATAHGLHASSGLEFVGHRYGRRHHWRRHCYWDRVCWRDRWGHKRCKLQRVCRPRWH